MLPARGRPVRPGDIMILVRRRNDFFEDMVRTLKQWGIPVAGTDRMILSDQLAIMDLVALGRFVLLEGAPHAIWLSHSEDLKTELRAFIEEFRQSV